MTTYKNDVINFNVFPIFDENVIFFKYTEILELKKYYFLWITCDGAKPDM